MDKKYLWIGGGVLVLGGVAFVVIKSRANKETPQEDPQSPMMDTAYMGGLAPTSGGFSSPVSYTGSDAGAVSSTPAVAGNSGSTQTGGGFDIGTLFAGLMGSQAAANQSAITTQGRNYESTILASVVGQNGQATVSHSPEGTTVVTKPAADAYENIINGIFQKELGRNAAAGGMTFYKNELINVGRSIKFVEDQIHDSPEAVKRREAAATK